VVAWSANAVRSRWVADEADLALETGKLLPISLDGTRSPMGFRQLQTIDFSSWSGGDDPCVSALLDALVHHLRAASRAPNQALTMPISAQTKTDASIAVLPFLNMSADPDQEYFADGISEELLNLLAKIKELAVIARTSCFNFKGTNKSISEIGTILGVSFVLEGSIRKAGNRVRITAQLVETKSSHHLWSETYDRDLDDIFAIQDEISLAIVGELKDQILGGSDIKAPQTERTSNLDAYEQYLQGQQLLNSRIRDNTIRSKELFEEALARDPDYAPALIGLADAQLLLSDHWTCMGVTPIKEALADAKPMLDRALEINPNAAEALGVKALYFLLEGNIEAAIGHTKKALTVNPNYSRGHRLNGIILWQLGDPEAPISSALESAIECDPASLLD
jgi:adenylate cyclase